MTDRWYEEDSGIDKADIVEDWGDNLRMTVWTVLYKNDDNTHLLSYRK